MPKTQALEYEAQVPAFLQRMKQGHAALDGRQNVQIPRAHGARGKQGRLNMAGEEGEDDPVVLDENGNIVSKDEMEALKQDKAGSETGPDATNEDTTLPTEATAADTRGSRPDVAGVSSGFGRKRKAAKVVGEEDGGEAENEEGTTKTPVQSLETSTKNLQHVIAQNKENTSKEGTKKAKKKRVKLSFDDPE